MRPDVQRLPSSRRTGATRRLPSIILALLVSAGLGCSNTRAAAPPSTSDEVSVKIALLHFRPIKGALAQNLAAISALAKQAFESGARIVVTPELATSGFFLTRDEVLNGFGLAKPYYAWGRRAAMADVLLAGIAVTLAAGAAATAVQSMADSAALFATAKWSLGQLSQVGYEGVWMLGPIVIASVAVLLSLTRALQVLAIDEGMAHAQGVAVVRVRIIAIVAAALGVAGCVAWCGPIAFVGLIVPHLVRRTVGSAQRIVLPLSLPCGAAFLVLCDTLARIITPDRELPVGVITAALGAIVLMGLVSRRSA